MLWYEKYRMKTALVFRTALSRIAEFPPPLDRIGQDYAMKFDPTADEGGKDYICALLPFWMQDAAGISDEQCERLALANIYGMLYFFIQDDVMDSPQPGHVKPLLTLANLLQMEMHRIFLSLFPSESLFWSCYDRYVTTWADCVMNEKERDFFLHDPKRMAGKAGPVKLSSAGALLLAGRSDLIAAVDEAVDIALMTLQMMDDWADWQDDLADGSYNGLLSLIAHLTDTEVEHLTAERIKTQIYVKGVMESFADAAERNHARLLELPVVLPDLIDYHAHMADSLRQTARRMERNKRKSLGGGINFLASSSSS